MSAPLSGRFKAKRDKRDQKYSDPGINCSDFAGRQSRGSRDGAKQSGNQRLTADEHTRLIEHIAECQRLHQLRDRCAIADEID